MLTYKTPQRTAKRSLATPRVLRPRVVAEHADNHDVVGPYALLRKLGFGGMGDVFLAEHRQTKQRCAIKLIRAEYAHDANAIARFQLEAQAAASLDHPHIVSIFDQGMTNDGRHYYVMEYLPGMNLDEIVRRFGAMPAERVVSLLRQICSALSEAHAKGLVHRDIKPANIIATYRDEQFDIAKLIDFGLVKSHNPDETILCDSINGSRWFAAVRASRVQRRTR